MTSVFKVVQSLYRLTLRLTLIRMIGATLALMCLTVMQSQASSGQFYFMAKAAESEAAAGQSANKVVYLRWGALQAQLPSDVSEIQLRRNNEVIYSFAPNETRSAQAINALYQQPRHQQRLAETYYLLQEEAANDAQLSGFSQDALGQTIVERLQQPFWRFLSARRDFVIAMAANEAYLDEPGEGRFIYELLAIGGNAQARLGLVELNTADEVDVPAVGVFNQIDSQRNCDNPDRGRDNYSVRLNWTAAPSNGTAQTLALGLSISGYELYRSKTNLPDTIGVAPVRDLKREAQALGFDAQGAVAFDDLEKVNPLLLTVSPDQDPLLEEWLETQDQLANAGLKPGDRRAYYIVPRDFAGHYGETKATIVQVPDLLRPPSPWNVHLVAEQNALALQWDAVNSPNYREAFGSTRRFCYANTNNAANEQSDDSRLYFVPRTQSCHDGVKRSVRFGVTEYLLYRFESFDQAAKFKDSDGDGVADLDEPDAKCNSAIRAGRSYQVQSQQESLEIDRSSDNSGANQANDANRLMIRSRDREPVVNKGQVYWYRVAAKAGKQVSLLSAPIRALVPDRTLPPQPQVSTMRPASECNTCLIKPLEEGANDQDWHITLAPGFGPNTQLGFTCNEARFSAGLEQWLNPNSAICQSDAAKSACAQGIDGVSLIPASGQPLQCQGQLAADMSLCKIGRFALTCEDEQSVYNGETVSSATITVGIPQDDPSNEKHYCASIIRNVDGVYTEVASNCDDQPEVAKSDLTLTVGTGYFCGYAVIKDRNNNISPAQHIPCFQVLANQDSAPSPPQWVNYRLQGDDAVQISWRLPQQASAATVIELQLNPDASGKSLQAQTVLTEMVSSVEYGMGASDGKALQTHLVQLPDFAVEQAAERWCMRLRAQAPAAEAQAAQHSDWSQSKCFERSAQGVSEPEQYLAWPRVVVPAATEDLAVIRGIDRFGADLSQGVLISANAIVIGQLENVDSKLCEAYMPELDDSYQGGVGEFAKQRRAASPYPEMLCSAAGLSRLNAAMSDSLSFALYRSLGQYESTSAPLLFSRWQEASPMIDKVHWQSSEQLYPRRFANGFVHWLNDPYIKLLPVVGSDKDFDIVYVDAAPLLERQQYRYQLVYFGPHRKILFQRISDPVESPALTELLPNE